ncbi:hypothetical protein TH53_04985 [Pedobacter lusitanus]|uniref:PNPLA domain-containing protein n=1 Tax=Pedobacter lusitanus TaxID=1503925 RepID=A0A0D0GLT8_9SPHI|nr:patatin-like phospholipase family protein [Pedobacter lusitanus]KIO78207.1 hypothetical protein TH53_04985 [Pedobacter lusitanus]
MNYSVLQPRKPEHIALSFSGGGFRAASYSLGCLSYMETVYIDGKKLTSLVHFISSASGGTITNLAYTASQRKGQSFQEFYTGMTKHILHGTTLIDRVFKILNAESHWKKRPDKSRNLINAFSIAYDELLFKEEVFGIYWKPVKNAVKEICANATEFDNGMLFRFQNAGIPGNKFLRFRNEKAATESLKKIKLADILACSSCFPLGFEPFVFPNDFTYHDLSKNALETAIKEDPRFSPDKGPQNETPPPRFVLMDGGIDDNQGIDSFTRAEERLQNKNIFGYDLYITCDVSSNYTSGYDFPEENKKSWLQKLNLLQYLLILVLFSGIFITGILTGTLVELCYAFLGINAALLLIAAYFFTKGFFAYQQVQKKKQTYGIVILGHIFYFLRLRLSVLLQLIDSRATSVAYLSAIVFLKKIRRVSYDRLFEKISERKIKADGTLLKKGEKESLVQQIELKHWRQFSLMNAIYSLSPKNDYQRMADLKAESWYKKNPSVLVNGKKMNLAELMKPSAVLQLVAESATEMDTSLWFDKNHQQEKKPAALIATGQFTTCYSLLRYAFRFDSNDPYWSGLQNQLAQDWWEFNQSPFKMYNKS